MPHFVCQSQGCDSRCDDHTGCGVYDNRFSGFCCTSDFGRIDFTDRCEKCGRVCVVVGSGFFIAAQNVVIYIVMTAVLSESFFFSWVFVFFV